MKMDYRFGFIFGLGAMAVFSPGVVQAANFTTAVQQGTSAHWAQAIWQPGAVTPVAGNTYECVAGGNPTRVRNPASGSGDPAIGVKTFPGDSLQLNTNAEIRAKGPGNTLDFPGVGGNPGLIFNGGNIDAGDDAVFPVTGVIVIQNPSTITCGDAAQAPRGWILGAEIRGSARVQITKQVADTAVAAVTVTNQNNPFTGTWLVRSGRLLGTTAGSLGNCSVIIAATNATVIPKLEVNYDMSVSGSLTLTNGGQMILHQNCTFTDVIIEGTPLSPGLHTYAELSGAYPANFPAGGSGSISVQPPAPPSTPSNVVAVNGDSQVSLSWSAAANAASYFVKRSVTSGSGYVVVGTPTVPNFVDAGLSNGQIYYYVISATNSLGESGNSVEVVGRPNVAVTGLTATGGTGQVALAWNALPGASSYRVQRSLTSGGPYTSIATGLGTASYVDTNAPGGRTSFYTVVASLAGGLESGISSEAAATTAPNAPAVNATLFASTVIRFGWTLTDPIVSQFLVEGSSDNVNFTPLASLAPDQRGYTNSGLVPSTTYFYRVRAQNATGFSPYSAVASNTTPASGFNVNFATAAAPVPVGYIVDSGLAFGDRGNGFTYGWDRDISADARLRNAANSPDLRYDTFVHMIKATPPAIWNIALPNGFYSVHIVAGDPSNVDSVFQFDIEGALTPTVTPGGVGSFNNNWADFTVQVGVSDGQLTIKSGPNSQTTANNNKIDFIDIYPAIPVKPAITVQPQDVTIEQNRPVALSATATGSAVLQYQWYHADNTPVSDATNSALSFARPQPGDSGTYYLIVTNYGGSATSAPVTLTVTPDTVGPHVVSAGSLDGFTVGVCFDEEIDINAGGAQELGNYSINGGAFNIIGLTFRPDGKSVSLLVDGQLTGAFTVDVLDIPDYAGNANSSSTNGQVLGFAAQDVGGPAMAGRSYTCDGQTIEIVGGGADIWGTADQGYLATKPVSGDFDARVRVIDLHGSNTITKAVLTARESTNADSAAITMSVNPAAGRNQVEAGIRPVTGAATVAVGTSFVPAGVPNAWMRISRVGNLFTAYRSTNGVDWVALGQTNIAFAADLQVGIGVTAHDNTLLATGTFSGFAISQAFPDLSVTGSAFRDPVIAGQWESYTFSITNVGVGDAIDVRVRDALPPGTIPTVASSSQGACTLLSNAVICDLGTITNHGAATVLVALETSTPGFLTNSVIVSTFPLDVNVADNTATVVVTVDPAASQSPIVNFGFTGGTFGGAIQTQNGTTYTVQFKDDLNAATWNTLTTINGDGTVKSFTDPGPRVPHRFYRIVTP